MLPSLFVSHGAPTLPFDDVPARDFLRGLSRDIGKPRAILIASAHWDTPAPMVSSVAVNATIHDFHGFPKPLYDLRYAAPGDAALAADVAARLAAAGMAAQTDTARGLDHGAWVPLSLMYPHADIPVVQVSMQGRGDAAHHIALGQALAPLRQEDVLVMGSGGFVHNLRRLSPPGSPEPDWSRDFSAWMDDKLVARDEAALRDYRSLAPNAALAHPEEEHFMPLFVAYGAGGLKTTRLHTSHTFGALRMDAYAFG
jgi:4,5-DOPA dioxygenase extradiol